MDALWFKVILYRLFAHLTSTTMWRMARVEFITSNSWKISGEAILLLVLIMDGVGEGNLSMVTTFCPHDQVKVESLEALSTIHQHDSPGPSMVVVRRFTNSPYLPWWSFGFLYLDVAILSRSASSI